MTPPTIEDHRPRTGDAGTDPALRPRSRQSRRSFASLGVPVGGGVVLLYLTAFPLFYLVLGAFQKDTGRASGLTTANFVSAYTSRFTYSTFFNSVLFAVGAALMAFVIGTLLAYLVERTNIRFRGLMTPIVIAPLVLPGVIGPIAWTFLLDPKTGYVNLALEKVFGFSGAPLNLYSLPGMIWVQATTEVPLAFLMMGAAMKLMDSSLEESAMMSGASFGQTVRRITLPMLRPWAAAVLLLLTIRSLESFEVPAIIGIPAKIHLYTSEIYLAFTDFPPDYGRAAALAVGLLVISMLGVALYIRASRNSGRYVTVGGKGLRPKRMDMGGWKWTGSAFLVLYGLYAVVLPILVIFWASLLPFFSAVSARAFGLVSLDNYKALLTTANLPSAFRNSVLLAVMAATLVTLFTAVIAWVRHKSKIRGSRILEFLAMVPIAVPGLVLGMALIVEYVAFPIPIYGTIWILLIAYCVKFLPYGMRSAAGSLGQIGPELEEAASMSGSGWGSTFRRITLPLLRPGLTAGWIYIFIMSLREFSTSALLVSGQTPVISVTAFTLFDNGQVTVVAALGVVMILISGAVIGISYKLTGKTGIRL